MGVDRTYQPEHVYFARVVRVRLDVVTQQHVSDYRLDVTHAFPPGASPPGPAAAPSSGPAGSPWSPCAPRSPFLAGLGTVWTYSPRTALSACSRRAARTSFGGWAGIRAS